MCKVINLFTGEEIRTEEESKAKYGIGQRIYYTGDRANQPGMFRITAAEHSKMNGILYTLAEIDGDRISKAVFECSISNKYEGHCGTRFVIEEAYKEYKAGIMARYEAKAKVIRTETNLKNDNCNIEFRDGNSVSGRDLTDHYNDPAFYTRNKRSIKKAWAELTQNFNADMKMYDAMKILDKYNLNCHSYCAMD